MIHVVNLAYVAATLAIAPFFLFLAMITVGALVGRLGRSKRVTLKAAGQSRFLIVIPAHDEEGAIGSTVRSCRGLDYDPGSYSIHVIADNCSDGTASEAVEAGASVVERRTLDLRSKGHALEYFFTQTPQGRPDAGHDATVIIDADTVVDPGLLKAFDRALVQGKDWVQGYYTVRNPDASWRTRMMTYAFSLTNGVWMQGFDRLGLGVGLKGNGMCFSSEGLSRFPWKAYGLVEDMEFALMLRVRGERVRFEPTARVLGEMVSRGGAGANSQRRRWEAGRRSLRAKFARALVGSPDLNVFNRLGYLIDLFFPPLVTLAIGLIGVASIHVLAAIETRFHPAAASLLPGHLAMIATFATYALSPTCVMGLPLRYLTSLLALPYYMAWKVLIVFGRRPDAWIRTPREPQSPA